MAVSSGRSERSLDRLLYDEAYRFNFFEAVRLLTRLAPERVPVGQEGPARSEIVRFSAYVSLTFPASQIYDLVRPKAPDDPPKMVVAFLGLIGPSAALPRYYTELVLERARRKDFTLRDFLYLFNHRLISLFYRAWEKYRVLSAYERAEIRSGQVRQRGSEALRDFVTVQRPQIDRFSQCVLDLCGLGAASLRYSAEIRHELRPRRAPADETLRFYAGLLAQRHRSAVGLETMLCDYFDAQIVVQQFRGQWLKLAPDDQSSFRADGLDGNMELGRSTVVGERVWDAQSKFRLKIGPLRYRQFQDFLPSGTAYQPLERLTRLYVGQQFDFDVQLVLLAAEVPDCQLSNDPACCVRLGWDTWLFSRGFDDDVSDAVFSARDG
ncbi:MAG TPA: type VI secretion system baseplate subunit TssG [Pirellulales bacterium]|nr:type VI secretion system baseplate subunit TssG [Pirellulales bacterium]